MTFLEHMRSLSPVAADVLVISMVAVTGIAFGRLKVAGVRLGVAGVLFSGLAFSHFGLEIDHAVAHFLKEFGLLLFVFTLGLQLGPGFFASMRKQGLRLNLYAFGLVAGGVLVTVAGAAFLGIPLNIAAGLFSGATTNTPALGAVQQAMQTVAPGDAVAATVPAMAYAAAYPLAIVGIIASMVLIRTIFKIDVKAEAEAFLAEQGSGVEPLVRVNLAVENCNLDGLQIQHIPGIRETGIIVSRIRHQGEPEVHTATPSALVRCGDVLLAVGTPAQVERFRLIVGRRTDEDLMHAPGDVTYRRVVLTNRAMLGKTVRELGLDHIYGVTVTRVTRQDLVVTALPDLRLQFGDMLQIVGDEKHVEEAARALGNSVKLLNETNFAAIFAGIALGVIVGLYPFQIGSLPAPVRFGLAGGPLIVAILLSRLGKVGPFVLHMPVNANTAFRELGIILFLACVGLGAGGRFAQTVFTAQGLQWVLLGLIITMLPLLIAGITARLVHRMNYVSICGILSGGMTDPPALAFASSMAGGDSPAVAYAAVYPLTMLLRIVSAQLLALAAMG